LNTLSRKLYIPKVTEPQINTAICWAFGSRIRGTCMASAMVAKDNTASGEDSQPIARTCLDMGKI
jgi:hypothetical protein